MAAAMRSLAAGRRRARSRSRRTDPIGADLALETGPRRGEGVARDLFVDVDRLCVLAEIVQAGKAAGTVALKGTFARMFPGGVSNMADTMIDGQVTYRMCRAKCSLRVKLRLQGGKSVQKKRWPFFFFFEGRPVSSSALSGSDASSSSSDPSMSISPDGAGLAERDGSSVTDAGVGGAGGKECVKGEIGSGLLLGMPVKLCLVGVDGGDCSCDAVDGALSGGARGVVGVVTSPVWSRGGNRTLTD